MVMMTMVMVMTVMMIELMVIMVLVTMYSMHFLQRVEEALKFAADHLAERGEEDSAVLQELERTLALLAFEDPASCPFSDLLAPSHRQQVREVKSRREKR